jgi:predicted acyltransferase
MVQDVQVLAARERRFCDGAASMAAEAVAPGVTAEPVAGAPSERLMSLDALRGFDMFWIVGAEGLVHALRKISPNGVTGFLSSQLTHKDWAGFAFYDLIFPLFVFIVGASIVFSLPKTIERYGRAGAFRRILVRGLLLFVAGLIYSGGVSRGWQGVRILGVLQRIAICYTVAASLFTLLRWRGLVAACATVLVGYWALMTFVPIRDISLERKQLEQQQATAGASAPELFERTTSWVRGSYEPGHNLSDHFDFRHLPGRKYDGAYDPEGILSTLPAVATCLLGVFAGLLLRRRMPEQRKVRILLLAGAASVALGFLWGLQFPVVKKIWTSSFVLVAGGYSAVLLGVFHQILEVWRYRRWAMPFVWIGTNALTIYLLRRFMDFSALAERFVGGPIKGGLGPYGELLVTVVALLFTFAVVRFLYRRRIFIRL